MTQQNGVINEIATSYTVAQPIQTEAKSYNNQIFVLPSPSTPTPQMSYTTSTNSQSTIVQVQQQTPPQNTAQPSSQYVMAQKQGQAVGISSQQVILQGPPTPYGNSPTTSQVQVITQGGNAMVSPTQIQYQYSVTPPLTNDKDIQMKQEGKVSPEMSIGGSEKLNIQDSNDTKENVSPVHSEKEKMEGQAAAAQDNGKAQILVKEKPIHIDMPEAKEHMNIDGSESKNVTVMTTLDPSAVMTQTITNPQNMNIATTNGMVQATPVNPQNMSMMNTMQTVSVINPVNKINVINGMNGNVNYLPANMNIDGTTPTNVNINGMNTIQGVQVATAAIPQTINNMNMINNNGNNIIGIPQAQQAIPVNANNSINLYYNQGQNVMNGTPNAMINYANANMMKGNVANKNSNGYNARTKNSHIVDPDVPIEVLIKRRKNTEAARRSRLRKAERIQVLTEIVHNLEEKNREYTIKIAELQGEQANWAKKEAEYVAKVKQLQERLKILDPEAVNDENDKNSFNIATPTTTTEKETESTTTTTEAKTATETSKEATTLDTKN